MLVKKGVKDAQRKTARERIERLFEQAVLRPDYADRYMKLIDRLKKRFRIRFSPEQRKWVCKRCLAFLVPARTCTVRTKDGRLIITCSKCGRIHRYPLVRDRK